MKTVEERIKEVDNLIFTLENEDNLNYKQKQHLDRLYTELEELVVQVKVSKQYKHNEVVVDTLNEFSTYLNRKEDGNL